MKFLDVMGSSGPVKASVLILGTDYFGASIPEKHATALLNQYWECGGTTIDTARIYGHWKDKPDLPPCSEAVLGRWMQRQNNRNEITLITKGGHPQLGDMSKRRISKTCIDQDLFTSLDSLRTDYVDIFFLHRDDPAVPVAEIMDILDPHIRSGRIRALGASNWNISRIQEANLYAIKNNRTPFTVSEINWSLAQTTPEMWGDPTLVTMDETEYQGYLDTKIPVFSFSSQARGYFSKGFSNTLDRAPRALRIDSPKNRQRLNRLVQLCNRYHCSPSSIALSYLTSAPIPTAAVIGCSTVTQITDCMESLNIQLSPADRLYLEQGAI